VKTAASANVLRQRALRAGTAVEREVGRSVSTFSKFLDGRTMRSLQAIVGQQQSCLQPQSSGRDELPAVHKVVDFLCCGGGQRGHNMWGKPHVTEIDDFI
jgi:hypothetical protein